MEDIRYPIGKFDRSQGPHTPEERKKLIDSIADVPEHLKQAVTGLNGKQLDTPYREGGWTVRQVTHHLADSHMNAYIRYKLALTEDNPTIKPYDEAAWARLADSQLPVAVSLDLIQALHLRWVSLLESVGEEDFRRGYVHPEGGRQTLAQVLALYDWHSRHHTAHIANLRSRMGW